MTADNQARGGVSEAEGEAAARAVCRARYDERDHCFYSFNAGDKDEAVDFNWRSYQRQGRAALEAAAQVRAGQDHGGEALYTEADAAKWQSEMDERRADYDRLGDAYNAVAKDLATEKARAAKAMERIKALEEALRPFAKAGELFRPRGPDDYDPVVYKPAAGPAYEIYGDHLRAAATILSDPPAPEPGVETGEVRNAVLEEAAKVAEAETGKMPGGGGNWDFGPNVGPRIATAIRALQTTKNGGRNGK